MDFLTNFYNLITIENAMICKIIIILATPIEIILSYYTFNDFLNFNSTARQRNIYISVFSIFAIINSIFVPNPFNLIFNYLVLFLIIKTVFKVNVLKTFFAVIIPLILFGLINSLIMNPFLKMLHINFEVASSVPIYQFLYLCTTYLLFLLILILIKNIDFKININFDLTEKTKRTIFLNLILGIITFVVQAFINFYCINSVPIIFTLFNFSLIFAYFFFSFHSLIKSAKLDVATIELENAESYNNSLTVLYDNVRGFKHDFDNMLNAIGGYVDSNDMNGLKQYYSSLRKDTDNIKNLQILNPNIITNPAIYNLLIAKYKKSTDLGISINFEFFFDFKNLQMPIYEFSRIFGILLDNAIEAASECNNKIINIVFRENQKNSVQIIKIENTFKNKDIDITKIFEKGISGKEKHSGIGLWEVNEIIKRNNNLVLTTNKDEKFFKQTLEIYY